MRPTNAKAQTKTLRTDLSNQIFVTITLVLSLSCLLLPPTWALSDKRLCADEKCERIISTGKTKIKYLSGEEGMIPFQINTPVRILSKSAGSNMKLWGVEINGRRGYANKDFIVENKIHISEKDLKFELPVQPLKKATESAPLQPEKPKENVQQTVLNASESAEDLSTTTTSPLDALKLSILTEQDQSGSHEAATPITPVQAKLQVVDGTELPLEALPATTTTKTANERIENLTKVEETLQEPTLQEPTLQEPTLQEPTLQEPTLQEPTLQEPTLQEPTLQEPTLQEPTLQEPTLQEPTIYDSMPTTTTSNDGEFGDYEEEYEDEDEDSTLDSKDNNEIPNDKKAADSSDVGSANVASKTAGEQLANVAQKAAESSSTSSSSATTSSSTTTSQETANQSPEAAAKQAENATPIAATETEANKTNLVQEIESIKAEQEALKLEAKHVVETTQPNPTEKQESQQVEAETQTLPTAEQSMAQKSLESVEQEIKTQSILREVEGQPITETVADLEQQPEAQLLNETNKGNEEQTIEQPSVAVKDHQIQEETAASSAEQLVNETTAQKSRDELDSAQSIEAIEALYKQEAAGVQLDKQAAEATKTMETEAKPSAVETGQALKEAEVNTIQTEAERMQNETQDAGEAQPNQVVTETPSKASTEEIWIAGSLEPPQTEAQRIEAPQVEPTVANVLHVESSTVMPREGIAMPPSLKPLFKQQQNFDNPNEYYKQLQEQQDELARAERHRQQEQLLRDTQANEQQMKQQMEQQMDQQHTTPSPYSYDDYEALHQAEPTPAPAPAAVVPEERHAVGSVEPIGLPSPPVDVVKEDAGPGLFTTIMDTVNSFISNQGQGQKEPEIAPLKGNDELHRLLYPDQVEPKADAQPQDYCTRPMDGNCHATITMDNFVEVLASKVLDHSLLLLCVVIAAASSLFFMLVYYCFCNSSQEGALLSKLNHLERSLLAAHKENIILKHELMTTRTKLSSIEDNSFGSNDMVASLKKQLETELYEKAKLQEQVTSLEKDLDNAAEAGLELNKMLSEVLNGQNGDEAFMSTVEELQQQLNDQEKIILEINASLADKSRENSELQYSYTESTARLTSEMKSLQQDNYELEMEKAKLQTRIEEIQAETELDLAKALEARNYEMQRLQHQIMESNAKLDKEHSELQTSLSKIEALEECLKLVKKDGNFNAQELIKTAKTRGELNAVQKKLLALQTKLEQEQAAKERLEMQLKTSSDDVEQLKQDFNQSESDKLEAQTRLEVLSGYFREKETELQKELSLQEAKWLQHQGENSSTVETQTLMKNEIQTLKSQNDELRAEIEAQIASHKAQMGTLENRAHESWLAARQSERRCEEAQAEAAGLRRKLTTMASGASGASGMGSAGELTLDAMPANGNMLAAELSSNPSPLPLPLPGSPGLLNMPNPLPFLPFMGLPPPFLPPPAAAGGARLPPLGRMRSPPPTSGARRGDRYDDRDERDDYSDYDDYDDEEEDERLMDRRRRHSGSWGRGGGGSGGGRGHRDDYMHSPRTYRSLSPSDSRYNYNDTETDFSPPPSPPPPLRRSSRPINEV